MPKLQRKLNYSSMAWLRRAVSNRNNRANGNFDLFDDLRDDERNTNTSISEASDFIVDIREYDVPYHVRVMIDLGR